MMYKLTFLDIRNAFLVSMAATVVYVILTISLFSVFSDRDMDDVEVEFVSLQSLCGKDRFPVIESSPPENITGFAALVYASKNPSVFLYRWRESVLVFCLLLGTCLSMKLFSKREKIRFPF